jgi:hypothetical protein
MAFHFFLFDRQVSHLPMESIDNAIEKPVDSDTDAWFLDVLGNIDLLRYIICWQKGRLLAHLTSGDFAAENGYLGLMKYKKDKMIYTRNAAEYAASRGHLDILKWLYANTRIYNYYFPMIYALGEGQLHVIQWLYEQDKSVFTKAHYGPSTGLSYARAFCKPNVIQYMESLLKPE